MDKYNENLQDEARKQCHSEFAGQITYQHPPLRVTTTMGGCVSALNQTGEVHSKEIDKLIKESFKREHKILLLGTPLSSLSLSFVKLGYHRFGRIREEHHSQEIEDYGQRGVY